MKKAKKILTLVACAVLLVCISVGATLAYLTAQTNPVQNTFTVGAIQITLDEATVELDETTDNYVAVDKENDRGNGNGYHLHPGIEAVKDPTIHVQKNSENCFVVAKIVVTADTMDNETEQDEDGNEVVTKWGLRGVLDYDGDETGLIGLSEIVFGGDVFAEGKTYTAGASKNEGVLVMYNDDFILTQQAGTVMVGDEEKDANIFYIYAKDEKEKSNTVQDVELFDTLKIPSDWPTEWMAALTGLKIDVSAYAVQADGFADVVKAFEAAFGDEYSVAAPTTY